MATAKPTFDITYRQNKDKWHLFVIVHGIEGGTHDNYDVVFNSDCTDTFFGTYTDAQKEAEKVLKEHKKKHGY